MSVSSETGIARPLLDSCLLASEREEVSLLILKAYFLVFIELDLSWNSIELAEMKHVNEPLEMIVNLLQVWTDKYGTTATVQKLYRALWECERHYNKVIGTLYCPIT